MIVLVTGGRTFDDRDMLFQALDCIHKRWPITTLIHGGAKGADSLSGHWAHVRGVLVREFRADWKKYGKSAGYRRNKEMAMFKPHLVVAFPGGKGTENMLKLARLHKLPILRFPLTRKVEDHDGQLRLETDKPTD